MKTKTFALILMLSAGCAENGIKEWKPPKHKPVNPVVLDLDAVGEDDAVFPAGVICASPSPEPTGPTRTTRPTFPW